MQARRIPTHRKKHTRPLRAVQEYQKDGTPVSPPRWRVELRLPGRPRRYFSTEQAALEFIAGEEERRRNLGQSAAGISPRLLEDALTAEEILRPYGTTLTTAARFYAETEKRRQTSKTALEVSKELIASRKASAKKKVHIDDIEDRLIGGGKRSDAVCFCKTFGSKPMAEITTQDVERWLAGLRGRYAPQSLKNFHRAANTLFNFAVPRNYCPRNVVKAIQAPTVPPKEEIGIFTPAETEAVLKAADHDLLPWLAIAFFAGLRSAEIDRLSWSDLKLDRCLIEVRAGKAKTTARRVVPILPPLAAWLAPYHDRKGGLKVKHFQHKRRLAYRAAGFGKPGTETAEEKAKRVRLRPAPSNVARHSFCSYRLADTQNVAQTAYESGHSVSVLLRVYRELVGPDEAAAYFRIRPEGETANVVPFSKAAATA